MGKQKKREKAARKAIERANDAIAEAGKRAAKADKKSQRDAAGLHQKLADAITPPKRKSASISRPAGDSAVDLTPPLPRVVEDSADTAAEFAGFVATSAPHDPERDRMTIQALRDVARAQGLRNSDHLTKAQLIERISG